MGKCFVVLAYCPRCLRFSTESYQDCYPPDIKCRQFVGDEDCNTVLEKIKETAVEFGSKEIGILVRQILDEADALNAKR